MLSMASKVEITGIKYHGYKPSVTVEMLPGINVRIFEASCLQEFNFSAKWQYLVVIKVLISLPSLEL